MNRSPLFYPLNRGLDADGGGAADLQTDVMRFMAILSLCLVAIFALVQSIPLAPVEASPEPVALATEPIEIQAEPDPEPEPPIDLIRPAPAKLPPEEAPVALSRPMPERIERKETVEAVPPASAPEKRSIASKAQNGFTLRFESDAALSRLVERDVVGLYAISGSAIHRMQIDAGSMSFWPASAPKRFHEMDAATVPAVVVDTWQRGNSNGAVKWGVSLPPPMASDLNEFLTTLDGGSLIIGRDGQLRLEQ